MKNSIVGYKKQIICTILISQIALKTIMTYLTFMTGSTA